jgi:hypothetical protein
LDVLCPHIQSGSHGLQRSLPIRTNVPSSVNIDKPFFCTQPDLLPDVEDINLPCPVIISPYAEAR